jgi:hypothetical protein
MFGKRLTEYLGFQMLVPTLVTWGLASLVMLIAKKVARRPAMA